jgi:MoxR-like ATPase
VIDNRFFCRREDVFPDARALRAGTEDYSDLYHSIENWEGLRRWKSEAELEAIRNHYNGRDAEGQDVEKRYQWIAQLDHHLRLSGETNWLEGVNEDQKTAAKADTHTALTRFRGFAREYIERWYPGNNMLDAFDAVFVGMAFGRHVYIEGSSGIGKTQIVREVCRMLSLPYEQYDAYADSTDLSLLGGEVPVMQNNALTFNFERGPLLTPGLLNLVIDELPRLPASTSNVLLQAMAERKVSVSLVASARGTATVLLSPHFIVIGTGNPVGYGGQGERSLALFDRFDIGIEMKHPGLEARRQILIQAAEGGQNQPSFSHKPGFTLSAINRLRAEVKISRLFVPVMVASAYALAPKAFAARTGTEDPAMKADDALKRLEEEGRSPLHAHPDEVLMWQAARAFYGKHKDEVRALRAMVEENLTEGSNPRGEISVIRNAQALTLVRHKPPEGSWTPPEVHWEDLGQAFHWANYARLKTYPGAEGNRGALLDAAQALFFDHKKWIAVLESFKAREATSRVSRKLLELGE